MTATDNRTSPIPQWKLERFVLGELPAEELARLRDRVSVDDDLRLRVEALGVADADIRRMYPAPWMARQIRARAQGAGDRTPASSWWLRGRWVLVPAGAVALVAIVAVPVQQGGEEAGDVSGMRSLAEDVRIKGSGAKLYLYRRTPDGTERLEDGVAARRGDLVRLQYDAAGAAYGAILSVDGGGTVTRHLPLQGDTAVSLASGGTVSLEAAYELDDAPRWERFFLVTSVHPFSVEAVLAAAQSAGTASRHGPAPARLELAEGLEQAALTLTKQEAAPAAAAR
jgi:hypothetical protein